MPRGTAVGGDAVDELTSCFELMNLNHTPMDIDWQAMDVSKDVSKGAERRNRSKLRVRSRRRRTAGMDRVGLADLCARLVQADAVTHFVGNYQSTLANWMSLRMETALPRDVKSSDTRIIAAFKMLDNAIAKEPGILSRLAHVQLICMFRELEDRVAVDRQSGQIQRDSGYRDASVALDIYMSAQDRSPDSTALRRALLERKRAGRRWTALAGPSPLFLLVYSPETETIVKNFAKFDDATLSQVAVEMSRRAPAELVRVCVLLTQTAELAVTRLPPSQDR